MSTSAAAEFFISSAVGFWQQAIVSRRNLPIKTKQSCLMTCCIPTQTAWQTSSWAVLYQWNNNGVHAFASLLPSHNARKSAFDFCSCTFYVLSWPRMHFIDVSVFESSLIICTLRDILVILITIIFSLSYCTCQMFWIGSGSGVEKHWGFPVWFRAPPPDEQVGALH